MTIPWPLMLFADTCTNVCTKGNIAVDRTKVIFDFAKCAFELLSMKGVQTLVNMSLPKFDFV